MDLWIIISILAALFQTVRFMLQKHLSTETLSASGATFARFVYSAPLAVVLALLLLWLRGKGLALPGRVFWIFAAIGGTAQVAATVCTVTLFGRRNFAVGVTFIKVEVLMTALIGVLLLGDVVTRTGLFAILIGVAGVLVLSGPIGNDGALWRRFLSPSAALGLAAGALFGVSAVCYRGASLGIDSGDPYLRALVTLAVVTTMQAVGMAMWLQMREPGETGRVLTAWRGAGLIGLTSMAGSFCWFTAFTLQNAAYVKAVGQVELIFAIFGSLLFFRERITAREWLGIALLSASILALVLAI